MNEKQKNETAATQAFQERIKAAKKKAIEDNIEKAGREGSKLTQTLNAEGDLVSVDSLASFDNRVERSVGGADAVTTSEMAHNLFNANNLAVPGQERTQHALVPDREEE